MVQRSVCVPDNDVFSPVTPGTGRPTLAKPGAYRGASAKEDLVLWLYLSLYCIYLHLPFGWKGVFDCAVFTESEK
jgi:hypothetical protein